MLTAYRPGITPAVPHPAAWLQTKFPAAAKLSISRRSPTHVFESKQLLRQSQTATRLSRPATAAANFRLPPKIPLRQSAARPRPRQSAPTESSHRACTHNAAQDSSRSIVPRSHPDERENLVTTHSPVPVLYPKSRPAR